jgi:hypothetical protein
MNRYLGINDYYVEINGGYGLLLLALNSICLAI